MYVCMYRYFVAVSKGTWHVYSNKASHGGAVRALFVSFLDPKQHNDGYFIQKHSDTFVEKTCSKTPSFRVHITTFEANFRVIL